MDLDEFVQALKKQDVPLINRYSELFLSEINPKDLINRIKRFRSLDIVSMSDEDLASEIENILIHNNVISIINTYSIFHKGTRFYRVRKLDNLEMPNERLKVVSDYWNPPVECIKKYGRINKPNESLLYTAFSPHTAICETHILKNDPFAIFVYEAKRDVRFSWIGSPTNYSHHHITNQVAIHVHEIVKKFLVDEFTREVPSGHEQIYRITEYIAKQYFVSPEGDGWRYPSVKNKSGDNICFKTDCLEDMLGLVGSIIGTLCENGIFDLEYVIDGSSIGKAIAYEKAEGYCLFKKLFPEFRCV